MGVWGSTLPHMLSRCLSSISAALIPQWRSLANTNRLAKRILQPLPVNSGSLPINENRGHVEYKHPHPYVIEFSVPKQTTLSLLLHPLQPFRTSFLSYSFSFFLWPHAELYPPEFSFVRRNLRLR